MKHSLFTTANRNLSFRILTTIALIYGLASGLTWDPSPRVSLEYSNTTLFTQNDGATPDRYTTYLMANGTPIIVPMPSQNISVPLQYTIMMWIRPQSQDIGHQTTNLFMFNNSLECDFDPHSLLICSSPKSYSSIQIDISSVVPNRWVHFALTGDKTTTQLTLSYDDELIGTVNSSYIDLSATSNPWNFCLGGCSGQIGFVGGVRELVISQMPLSQSVITRARHQLLSYDASIINYFRFGSQKFNKDLFKPLYLNISSSQQLADISQPSDICYPIRNMSKALQISQLGNNSMFSGFKIDARWLAVTQNYGFTFTTWLNIDVNTCNQSNPKIAMTSCYLMQIQNYFMVYMPTPTTIALYIEANEGYFQYSSYQVFVPQNEWVNLQIAFTQYEGYTIQVYDAFGGLISQQQEFRNLQELEGKSKNFSLFQGFSGQVKNFVLLSTQQNLPYTPPVVSQMVYTYRNDCLAYFDFQEKYLQIQTYLNGSISSAQFINFCNNTQYANQPVQVTRVHSFVNTPFQFSNYSVSSYWDRLFNNSYTFDGIACSNGNSVVQFKDPSSYLQTSQVINATSNTSNSIPNMTVEFWFKSNLTTSNNSQQYLITLFNNETSHKFMSIFYDVSGQLLCAPFDIDSSSSPYVSMNRDFADTSVGNGTSSGIWTHISCIYSQKSFVNASLYNSQKVNGPLTYTQSLTGSQFYIPNGTFSFIIGNSDTGTQGTAMLIKEVRVWTILRSLTQLSNWMYRELNLQGITSGTLAFYLRLTEPEQQVFSWSNLASSLQTGEISFNNLTYSSNSELVICPSGTYPGTASRCYKNPYTRIFPIIYPYLDTSGNLNWVFSYLRNNSSNLFSEKELSISWNFNDPFASAIALPFQAINPVNLTIPAYLLSSSQIYDVTLNITNNDTTFIDMAQLSFIPDVCRYYIVQGSDANSTYNNYTTTQSTQDIVFTLQLQKAQNNCQSFFNVLNLSSIAYNFFPVISGPQPMFTFAASADASQIIVTIPKQEQYKIPTKQDISIIFSLQFYNQQYQAYLSSAINASTITFQNIIYTLNLQTPGVGIQAALTANSTIILLNETVSLDSSGTTLINGSPTQVLTYQWICPATLASLCSNQSNTTLVISSAAFLQANGTYNQSYTFTLNISTLSGGKIVYSTASIGITWMNQSSTNFYLNYSLPILVTSNNTLRIVPLYLGPNQTYNFSDLTIQWNFTPALNGSQLLLNNGSQLVIQAGQLATNTQYNLTVTVFNTSSPNYTTRNQTIIFSTKAPPSGGSVLLSPRNGTINSTNFTVQLLNWQSANLPISYQLWSTNDSKGDQPLAQITPGWLLTSQAYSFKVLNLNPILVLITDTSQEVVMVSVSPIVQNISWTQLNAQYNQILNMGNPTDPASLVSKYTLTVQYCESLDENPLGQMTPSDKSIDKNARLNLIYSIQGDFNNIKSPTSTTVKQMSKDQQVSVVQNMMESIYYLTKWPSQMTVDVATISSIILVEIQTESVSQALLATNGQYRTAILGTAGNLLKFYSYEAVILPTKIGKDKNNTRLLQDDIDIDSQSSNETVSSEDLQSISQQVVDMKNSILNMMCNQVSDVNKTEEYQSDQFDLQVEKYFINNTYSYLLYNSTNAKVGLNLPMLLPDMFEVDQTTQSLCIQSTFYSINPLQTQNLVQNSIQTVEVRFVDDSSQVDAVTQTSRQAITLLLDLNNDTLAEESICMSYSQALQSWASDFCTTTLTTNTSVVMCECNMAQSSLYAVFQATDANSDQVLPAIYTSSSDSPVTLISQQSLPILSVSVLILLLNFVFPTVMTSLDKRDFKFTKHQIDKKTNYKLAQLLSNRSNLPLSYWLFKQIDMQTYLQSHFSLGSHLFASMYPIVGVINTFDARSSRVQRITPYLLQVTLLSFVLTLIFNPEYRRNDNRFEGGLDEKDIGYILLFGAISTLFFIPLSLQCRSKSANLSKTASIGLTREESIDKIKLSKDSESFDDQLSASMEQQIKELSKSKWKIVKYVLLVFSFIIAIANICLGFFFAQWMPISNQYCIIASFYIGLLGSMLLANPLRILLNAQLIPKISSNCVGKLFLSSQAKQIYSEYILVKEINEILTEKQQQGKQLEVLDQSNINTEGSHLRQSPSLESYKTNSQINQSSDKNEIDESDSRDIQLQEESSSNLQGTGGLPQQDETVYYSAMERQQQEVTSI